MPAFQGSGSLSSVLTALVLASVAGCSSGAYDAERSASNASALKKVGVDDGPKDTDPPDAGRPDSGKDAGGKKWGDLVAHVGDLQMAQVSDCTPAPPTGWRVRSDAPCTQIAAAGGSWVPTPFFRTAATPLFIQQRICQYDWVPSGCTTAEPDNTPFLDEFHRKAISTCATDSEGCTGSFGTTTAPHDPWSNATTPTTPTTGRTAVTGAANRVALAADSTGGGGSPPPTGPIFGGFHCDSCAFLHDSTMYVILPPDYLLGPDVVNRTSLQAGNTSYDIELQGTSHVFAAPLNNPSGIAFDNDQVTSVY